LGEITGMTNLKIPYSLILILSGILSVSSPAQESQDSGSINRPLLNGIIISESVLAAGSLTGLYLAWYADYPHSSFHFINDNSEWLQMDKMGHLIASYNIGRTGYGLLRLADVDKRKSLWYGGTLGLAYLTVVEVMDGFSEEWGASAGDMAANALGTAIFIGQQIAWDEQRFSIKYSYHESGYAGYWPEQLGSNFPERMLKDYNGQTIWLSANIHSFLKDESGFPAWLNIAAGYGADGLMGAKTNLTLIDGKPVPSFDRTRRYFLSPDVDLTRIKTRSKVLKTVFTIASFFKIPAPALEFRSGKGVKVHGLYF
jgi:hypothetical protein